MKVRRLRIGSSLLLGAAFSAVPLIGCVENDDGYHHRRPREREVIIEEEEHYHRPPVVVERDPVVVHRPPVVVEREPVRVEHNHREPTERARGIPQAARLMEEGRGRIDFRSRRDGEVWIEDTHDLKLVFQGRLFDDEAVVVEPEKDQILINGRRARVKGLQNDHRFRIYFVPATGRYERYGKGRDPRFDHY